MPSGSIRTNSISGQVKKVSASSICKATGRLDVSPSAPWNVNQTITFKAYLGLKSSNINFVCDIKSATATLYVNGSAAGSFKLDVSGSLPSAASGSTKYTIPSSDAGKTISAYAVINYEYGASLRHLGGIV